MSKQADFLEQETLVHHFVKELGVESDRSPIYHPEIAGEGIEYDLGCSKLNYFFNTDLRHFQKMSKRKI